MTLSKFESENIDALIVWLSKLTAGDREEVFVRLRAAYCLVCGSANPRCHCLQEAQP
jgi:hypothetical protein